MRIGFVRLARLSLASALLAGPALAATFDVLDTAQQGVEGVVGLDGARAIATSPDGADVYVVGSAGHSIAGFGVDGAGALTPLGAIFDDAGGADGLHAPVDVAVSRDGRHVYVASFGSTSLGQPGAVAILSRDTVTGALTFVDAIVDADLTTPAVNGASGVVVSPDDRHVYVTSGTLDSVAAFSRDDATGLLTLIEVEGHAPPQILDGAVEVATSPDGALVYVIAQGFTSGVAADSLVTFARDDATGALTRIDTEQDLVEGVSGLTLPVSLAVSPDGAHVYTVAGLSNSVAVFGRALDDSTAFVAAYVDGFGDVNGLAAAAGVAVTRDGDWVLATGVNSDAVVLFARGPGGFLEFETALFDSSNASLLLDAPFDVATDPRGRFVYVVGTNEDALTVLAPEPRATAMARMVAIGAILAIRVTMRSPRSTPPA